MGSQSENHRPVSELPVTVYTPESSLRNPARMVRSMFRDLLASRELAWQLAVRDIRAQYRQTALGLLWAFILPLANTGAWLFIQSTGIVTIQGTELPYPVYVFTGTMLWAIFMDAVNAPLQQTIAAKPMLAKINFPREGFILSGIYQTLFNASIKIRCPPRGAAPGERSRSPGRVGGGPCSIRLGIRDHGRRRDN